MHKYIYSVDETNYKTYLQPGEFHDPQLNETRRTKAYTVNTNEDGIIQQVPINSTSQNRLTSANDNV